MRLGIYESPGALKEPPRAGITFFAFILYILFEHA